MSYSKFKIVLELLNMNIYDMYFRKYPKCMNCKSLIVTTDKYIRAYTMFPKEANMVVGSVFSSDKRIFSAYKLESQKYAYNTHYDLLIDTFALPVELLNEKDKKTFQEQANRKYIYALERAKTVYEEREEEEEEKYDI